MHELCDGEGVLQGFFQQLLAVIPMNALMPDQLADVNGLAQGSAETDPFGVLHLSMCSV